MFDYFSLQNSAENPTLVTAIFTVLLAFILSTVLVFTYEKTTREVARSDHFMQGMILIAIVAATVMQAIGDSLARGLGMLGALSIVRFRTTVRDPRNIVFMFMSLAIGIACGVYGFLIAFIGTIAFSVSAFILRLTPFSKKNNLIGSLKFDLLNGKQSSDYKTMQRILQKHCSNYAVTRYKTSTESDGTRVVSYEYSLKLKKEGQDEFLLSDELMPLSDIRNVRLNIQDTTQQI
ncbi:MAG: DUF4956 domain-containing protein [Saprospiraceae bacterium]|nr:DUF4956 domain-containing protein [Saprospiraceae bacterium]MCB9324475.1 DUF4956 domain-containing protein [Lewinellaceae bacterium]